jgi:hypothetical protein
MNAHTTVLRGVKTLAAFKPSVLIVLQSNICGWSALGIPVSPFFIGWR